MPLDITDIDTEYAGAMRIRILHVEITDYDSSGEPFDRDDAGMSRIQDVNITPDGAVFSTGYDFVNNQLLTDLADGENAEVKVTVFGR